MGRKPRSPLRGAWVYVKRAAGCAVQNRRFARGEQRFLVVRHAFNNPTFFDVLLRWLEDHLPEVRARFELHLIPGVITDWSRFVLHIPWLQDPVQNWSLDAYRRANQLAAACDRRHIPIINRVDRLANAGKSTGARLIASAGLRTPRMIAIEDAAQFRATGGGLALPLFVRDDWGHGGRMLRADTAAEVHALPIEKLTRPIAVELHDARDPRDGLVRKYRYLVAGDAGVALSMHVGKGWIVRGTRSEHSETLVQEEIEYGRRANPLHARFVAATRALGLDFVAFDYSLDRAGEPIVWEANPFPMLHFAGPTRRYRWGPTTRALAAMVQLYFVRAGIAVPAQIAAIVDGPPGAV